MNNVKIAVLGLCVLAAIICSAALVAAPERVSSVCCSGPGDCGAGEKCCDALSIGLPDCDPEVPGYCRSACIPGVQ